MEYGLTSTGFNKKSLSVIKAELEDTFRGAFGEAIDLDTETPFGQIIGIFSERESSIWEALQAMYYSQYRGTAEGYSLDDVNALILVPRLDAIASNAIIRARGDENTFIPIGSVISKNNDSDIRFITQQDYIIAAPVNAVQTFVFSAVATAGTWTITFENETTSSLAYNASLNDIKVVLENLNSISEVNVAGTYDNGIVIEFIGADGGIQKTSFSINSNLTRDSSTVAITVVVTNEGGSYIDMYTICDTIGPIEASANSLTVIDTIVNGWNEAYNLYAAEKGRNIETDEDYRLRAENSIQQSKSGTVEAIISSLEAVDNVLSAIVLENTTLSTDVNGLPPKSFEAIVDGGSISDIAKCLWNNKPAGIQSYGNLSADIVDSQGVTHTMYFSRPEDVLIYIDVTVSIKSGYTVTVTQIQDALIAFGEDLKIGETIIVYPDLIASLSNLNLLTIDLKIGTSPNPTSDDNILLTTQQRSIFSTNTINVTIS